jgi:hypothetical protein
MEDRIILSRQSRNQTRSLVPKLRLGILKLEAPASRLFLWRGRERTEPVGKQSFLCWVSQAELGKQQKIGGFMFDLL